MDRESQKIGAWTLAMPLLLVAIAIIAMLAYREVPIRQQMERAYTALQRSAEEQADLLRSEFEEQQLLLTACAKSFSNVGNADWGPLYERLNDFSRVTCFYRLGLLDASGTGYSNSGIRVDESASAFFKESMAGHSIILKESTAASQDRFVLSVPIYRDGKVVGVLYGSLEEQNFNKLLAASLYGDTAYAFICDGSGEIISGSGMGPGFLSSGNVLTCLSSETLDKGFYTDNLAADLENSSAGHTAYTLDGQRQYSVYLPVGINDWMLFRVLFTASVEAEAGELVRSGNLILTVMGLASILVLVVFYMINARSRRWLENEQEQLRLSDARFRIALENSHVSIWDYDFATHSIIQAEHSLALHGDDRVILNVPHSLVAGGIVHPESAKEFVEMYHILQSGEKQAEGVFRIRRGDSGYWYQHIRYKTIYDAHGKPYRAIGMAEDVTERYEAARQYQKELNQLSDLAQRDQLTGLLNRSALEKEITARLETAIPDTLNAMYLIDLDGFKKVNDELGHQRGDRTLSEISQAIRGVFRTGDLVGRLGGDEFIVFLTVSGTPDLIESRANELCNALQFVYTGGDGPIHVTASIGVAICTGSGHTFAELYADADKSLYRAKEEGRNRYILSADPVSGTFEESLSAEHTNAIPLKTLLEYMDGGILMCEMSREIHVLYASPSFYTCICHDHIPPENKEQMLLSMIYPEDRPGLISALFKGAADGSVVDFVYRTTTCCGEQRGWHHLRAVRIPDANCENPIMLGVVTDITELMAGREELKKSNERLHFAFEQSGLILWEADPSSRKIRFWLRENEQAADTELERIIRNALQHRDEDERLHTFFDGLYCGRREEDEGMFFRQENDMFVRFRLAYRLLRDDMGNAVSVIGVAEPVCEVTKPMHAD
ncbi:MAG: diguanylate cyclase [Clostridiaceae bacterium]|nr:diguanylate cyclase [Clostridiaceae bacterium]